MDKGDILVVDDERLVRQTLAMALESAGYVVHEAATGEEAIALFREMSPALVVIDIVMPDGDGIETIRAMREHAPSLPIIAISGAPQQMIYLRAASSLGATVTLQKPFGLDLLFAAVSDLLQVPKSDNPPSDSRE